MTSPVPTPAELEDLRVGVAAWELALEAADGWLAQDRDRVVDACSKLLADPKLGAYGLHALCNVIHGLLDTLAQFGMDPKVLWAYYASTPKRMRAEYGFDSDGAP